MAFMLPGTYPQDWTLMSPSELLHPQQCDPTVWLVFKAFITALGMLETSPTLDFVDDVPAKCVLQIPTISLPRLKSYYTKAILCFWFAIS